jgi:hypothetical protein
MERACGAFAKSLELAVALESPQRWPDAAARSCVRRVDALLNVGDAIELGGRSGGGDVAALAIEAFELASALAARAESEAAADCDARAQLRLRSTFALARCTIDRRVAVASLDDVLAAIVSVLYVPLHFTRILLTI